MNSLKIAAALRVLALAFESDEGDAAGQPALAAEPVKRGRGRPVKGEETAAPAASAPVQASSTTSPTPAVADDPFAAPPAAPAAPVATLDEVRAALKALQAASSQAVALEVLKTAGEADNLTSLAVAKYGVVVVAAKTKQALIFLDSPKPASTPDPFEVTTAATPAEKPPTLEDVKAVIVETQKRASQDKAQQVVMQHGGKAPNATGGEGVSLKALPEANYAATIAALKALPTTK